MNIQQVTLIGERVEIRPMTLQDLPVLVEAGKDARIWSYMPVHVQSPEEMEQLVAEAVYAKEAGTEFPFVIYDKVLEKIVGSTRFLNISRSNRHLEIGWTWLSPDVWRTRVNTECKYLLLTHCFETLKTIRVQLKTDARNVRSQAAIERMGGVKEGVLRNHVILPDGYVRDSVFYSVIDKEWPVVKMNLERRL